MPGSVSLPHLGVSVGPGGCSLNQNTLDEACQGVTLLVGVSLPSEVAAGGTPANGYVAEDGTTFYVAEDGTTFYVQEV